MFLCVSDKIISTIWRSVLIHTSSWCHRHNGPYEDITVCCVNAAHLQVQYLFRYTKYTAHQPIKQYTSWYQRISLIEAHNTLYVLYMCYFMIHFEDLFSMFTLELNVLIQTLLFFYSSQIQHRLFTCNRVVLLLPPLPCGRREKGWIGRWGYSPLMIFSSHGRSPGLRVRLFTDKASNQWHHHNVQGTHQI